MKKPEPKPEGWLFKTFKITANYAECPKCGFSFNIDMHRELPYFCGGCGKDMRNKDSEAQHGR